MIRTYLSGGSAAARKQLLVSFPGVFERMKEC